MMPHCKRDTQFELFAELQPAATTAAIELPVQRSKEVDPARVAAILGVSKQTVLRLIAKGLIPGAYQLGGRSHWRIAYDGVVAYCNMLRVRHHIPMRQAPAHGRARNAELLPFPLADTVSVDDVRAVLDCHAHKVIHLIEEGKLIAYQILPEAQSSPWRICKTSLDRYVASLHAAMPRTARVLSPR